MSDLFFAVDGHRVQRLTTSVPPNGPWWADAVFDEAVELTGSATVSLGSLELHGTVDPRYSGSFGGARSARVVAGGGGWATDLPRKSYSDPAGVKALQIATDSAREAGETLGTFDPPSERVGTHFVRRAGRASWALERLLGDRPWWVDYAGVTHGGWRAEVEADGTGFSLLSYSPRSRIAVLSVDDPAALCVGSILTPAATDGRLAEALTIRELAFIVEKNTFRAEAWCGGGPSSDSRLGTALGAAVRALTDGELLGVYRYRVAIMGDKSADLQAVSKARGLPDVLRVDQAQTGGTWVKFSPGQIVYVLFVAGDPADPKIVAADAELGASETRGVARMNDPTLTYMGTRGGQIVLGLSAEALTLLGTYFACATVGAPPVISPAGTTAVTAGIAAGLGGAPLGGVAQVALNYLQGTGHVPTSPGVPGSPGLPGGHLPGNVVGASKRLKASTT